MTDARSSNRRRINRRDLLSGEYGEPWDLLPARAASWIVKFVENERDCDLDARTPGYHRDRRAEGWESLRKVALYIAEAIRCKGARIQESTRSIGRAIGMSQSTASRKMSWFREAGILARYREHRVKYLRRSFYSSDLDTVIRMPGRWEGQAAIHELIVAGGHGHSCDSHNDPPPDLLSHNS